MKCRAFKKQKSMINDRPRRIPKNTTSDEVSELGVRGKASSQGKEEDKGEVDNAGNLTKDSGHLSLIKGFMGQGEAASGTRRVLKHRGSPTGA